MQLTNNRTRRILRGVWFMLALVVLVCGFDYQFRWISEPVRYTIANHWLLFGEFAFLSVCPLYLSRKVVTIVLSIATVLLIIAVDSTRVFLLHGQKGQLIIGPEILGVMAGVLLGMNLRAIRERAKRQAQ